MMCLVLQQKTVQLPGAGFLPCKLGLALTWFLYVVPEDGRLALLGQPSNLQKCFAYCKRSVVYRSVNEAILIPICWCHNCMWHSKVRISQSAAAVIHVVSFLNPKWGLGTRLQLCMHAIMIQFQEVTYIDQMRDIHIHSSNTKLPLPFV